MKKSVETPGNSLHSRVSSLVKQHREKNGALFSVLEEIQDIDEYSFLSEEALRTIAQETGTPLARVYSVASFYSYFNLAPQGQHTIVVCRGTSCNRRNSLNLLREAMSETDIDDFEMEKNVTYTTEDKVFTIRTVECFGQCALSPVVAIDGKIYPQMTAPKLRTLINSIRAKTSPET